MGRPSSPLIEARLRAIESLGKALGTATEIRVEMPAKDTQKAEWLDASGRPFFVITPRLRSDVTKAMQAAVFEAFEEDGTVLSVAEIFFEGSKAVRQVFLKRFEQQGYDVFLWPLTHAWQSSKARRGFSTLIGVHRGQLLGALRRARITFNARF